MAVMTWDIYLWGLLAAVSYAAVFYGLGCLVDYLRGRRWQHHLNKVSQTAPLAAEAMREQLEHTKGIKFPRQRKDDDGV